MAKKTPMKNEPLIKEETSSENMECDEDTNAQQSFTFNLTEWEEDSSSSGSSISEDDILDDKYSIINKVYKTEDVSDQSDVDDKSNIVKNIYESHDDSDWSDVDMEPMIHQFIGHEGLKVNLSANTSTVDTFSLLFDDLLIAKIVNWTNAQASFLLNTTHFSPESNMKKWTDVTVEEMKKFLGLSIMMGNIHMPTFKSYWSTSVLYHHPLFGRTMSRNRFEAIIRCLCFYNEMDDTSHRLHKIDQVLKHLLQNIQNTYYPGENLSINEAVLLSKDLLYKNPVSQKKPKQGIKLYELCTPDGFVLNILIHSGKEIVTNLYASCVVNELLTNYLEKGHTVYMDSSYNSVQLAIALYKKKTHAVGILKTNCKGNPRIVEQANLNVGEYIFRRKDNILVQKWKDKQDILTISTKHKAILQEVLCKNGTKLKPQTIIDYKKYMSSNNRRDQMLAYYSTLRKPTRWHLKVFFYLFDVAIWNGYWLFNKTNPSSMSYLDYRNDIALNLLNIDSEKPMIPRTNNVNVQHFPQKLDRRRRCRVCAMNKHRTATWYACEICKTNSGEPIGLCADKCFKIYHKI